MTPETFWENVTPARADECWIWNAYLNDSGYGQARWNGCARLAHRIAYTLMIGEIPDGLVIDHLCRTPACVNPYHMDPVTLAVNTARGNCAKNKREAILCKRGHVIDAWDNRGMRFCFTCRQATQRAWYLRKKSLQPGYYLKKAARS